MKKYTGNMLAYLNQTTKAVGTSQSKQSEYKIEVIDATKIIPNKGNFYGIRDVEALAKRMAVSHNITPAVVVAAGDGTYTLISGERRRAAVLYRWKNGEIATPSLPCIVRQPYQAHGNLTAKMAETIGIICENDYRTKTTAEKLQEVLQLEPIARLHYDEAIENKTFKGPFRTFFAENFLGISPSSLQRLLALQKLIPIAMEALITGQLSETAAAELAYKTEAEQLSYMQRFTAGAVSGTVAAVRGESKDSSKDKTSETKAIPSQKSIPSIDSGVNQKPKDAVSEPVEVKVCETAAVEENVCDNTVVADSSDKKIEPDLMMVHVDFGITAIQATITELKQFVKMQENQAVMDTLHASKYQAVAEYAIKLLAYAERDLMEREK